MTAQRKIQCEEKSANDGQRNLKGTKVQESEFSTQSNAQKTDRIEQTKEKRDLPLPASTFDTQIRMSVRRLIFDPPNREG